MPRPAFAPIQRSPADQAGTTAADAALVVRAQAGDRQAFEQLLRRHAGSALVLAQAIVADPSDADDVCQVALVRCWDRLGQCREPARFRAWLLAVVRSVGYDHHRRVRRRRTDRLEAAGDVFVAPRDAEPALALRRALGTLTPVQREVLLLADLDDLPHKEIARVVGVSEFMSRRHLSDARRRMRVALAREKEETDDT